MPNLLTKSEATFVGCVTVTAAIVTGVMLWWAAGSTPQTELPGGAIVELLLAPGWVLTFPLSGLSGGVHGDYADLIIPVCAAGGNALFYGALSFALVKMRDRPKGK